MIIWIFLVLIFTLKSLIAENLNEISFNETVVFESPYNRDCRDSKVSKLIDKGGDYASIYDLARDMCGDSDDSDLSRYFDSVTKEVSTIYDDDKVKKSINCLKFHLLKLNASGALIDTFDRNILNTFQSDDDCEAMIKVMHDGPAPDNCTLLAPPFHGYLKAAVLSAVGNYSREIIEAERINFIADTKFQWNFHLNCLIETENNKN